MRRAGALLLAVGVLPALAGMLTATPASAQRSVARPYVQANQTVPVYSYTDAIRESVWVETPLDNDGDGRRDRVAVDLVRPREAARAGVKVPVVMEASPYFQCCGRGNEAEIKEYDANGTIAKEPLFYDNYFVPRGYAFVAVDLAGTNRSSGCNDVGGPEDVLGAKAVIDWLNGRARGFHADGSVARADWTTGKVGMIGKSWDGTIANGVAATGVSGLATIVPISAISSWYDYERFNGVLRSLDYSDFLHTLVSGRPAEVCAQALAALNAGSDDATGDYNAYWDARNYRKNVDKVRASVFVVHGINDWNVTTSQFASWWQGLASHRVPRKIWLSEEDHVDPFDYRRAEWVDTLHRWFDHWLQGLPNGIEREPQASIEKSPGQWANESAWPARTTRFVTVPLGAGTGGTGTLGGRRAPAGTVESYTDNLGLTEEESVTDPGSTKDGRLVFLSAPLGTGLRLSGVPRVTLRVRVNRPTTQLTARLVDYGEATRLDIRPGEASAVHNLTTESCWGQSTAADDACYLDTAENVITADHGIVTRGWLDASHYASLRTATPLRPDRWYSMTIPLQAGEASLKAGHVLGLVLVQSDVTHASSDDPTRTLPSWTNATVEVSLRESTLTLPVAAGGLPRVADRAPLVSTRHLPATRRPDARPVRPDFR